MLEKTSLFVWLTFFVSTFFFLLLFVFVFSFFDSDLYYEFLTVKLLLYLSSE